jgi:secondary thiamine-phosphate synthase enzyme
MRISSLHTTCALSVNENEKRLFDDIRDFFLTIAPVEGPYKHNDLHLRINIPPDEPENAHAHLIAMMLGNSEIVTVPKGSLGLGRYQSILLLEMDGPSMSQLAKFISDRVKCSG